MKRPNHNHISIMTAETKGEKLTFSFPCYLFFISSHLPHSDGVFECWNLGWGTSEVALLTGIKCSFEWKSECVCAHPRCISVCVSDEKGGRGWIVAVFGSGPSSNNVNRVDRKHTLAHTQHIQTHSNRKDIKHKVHCIVSLKMKNQVLNQCT